MFSSTVVQPGHFDQQQFGQENDPSDKHQTQHLHTLVAGEVRKQTLSNEGLV